MYFLPEKVPELENCRESAKENVYFFKCHRKSYNGSASENTDLVVFCDTCLQWDSHYDIFLSHPR